jgi:hypothetical protein
MSFICFSLIKFYFTHTRTINFLGVSSLPDTSKGNLKIINKEKGKINTLLLCFKCNQGLNVKFVIFCGKTLSEWIHNGKTLWNA